MVLSARFSTDCIRVVRTSVDHTVAIWHRRRPEQGYGTFWLWEAWAVMVFGVGLIYSLYHDRRRFREQRREV